ncbi:hypothetical protein [Methanothermococcus okinawensis]|uniref:hypothetical protein n=1 Tax=Methanothermococcus okinawensis TaxID=155863 RepID=UPI000A07A020|nr:hypothetical protein [Methanothermococcus okinawensis]
MKKIFIFPILALLSLVPSVMGAEIGDINNDGSVDIADVVYLFKHRNVPLDDGDLNCDNSVDIADVVYLFKNYDKFREPVIFAKNLKLEPHRDEGYCYIEDADGNKFIALKEGITAPNIPDAKIIKIPLKSVVCGDQILLGTAYITKDENITNSVNTMQYLRYTAPKWKNELPTLYKRYQNGEILDAGTWGNPKYDNIINASPDMVFIHKIKRTEPMVAKLDELGITYSRTGAYTEDSFLGKIEWIKFFAVFYGVNDYKKVNNYFQETWKSRNNVIRKVRNINTYPKVACFYWSSSKGPYVWGA